MADESDRFALGVDDALGSCDVVFERKRRILDDAHVVAVLLKPAVDTVPAGAVDETAVDENNILAWASSHEKSPLPGRVFRPYACPHRQASAATARWVCKVHGWRTHGDCLTNWRICPSLYGDWTRAPGRLSMIHPGRNPMKKACLALALAVALGAPPVAES